MEYLSGVRRVVRFALVALTVTLSVAGCEGDDDASPPTVTVSRPATTTTAPADPYAIPATIDVAYVQRVIDKLYEIEADAVRIIVRERELVPQATDLLQALFLKDELNVQLRNWSEIVPNGLADFRSDPGIVRTQILEMSTARGDCVFVRVREQFGEVASDPSAPPGETSLMLKPKSSAQDPSEVNPTPWMIALDAVTIDGNPPEDRCD